MTEVVSLTLQVITCASKRCGFTFGVPHHWFVHMRDAHKSMYCPKCRSGIYWPGESDEEALRRKLHHANDLLATSRATAEHVERQRRAEKAAKTRLKNRIAAGVCPCCNRTFVNLQRHMDGQHPEFKPKAKTRKKK